MHTEKCRHFFHGKRKRGEGGGGGGGTQRETDLEGKTWKIGNKQIHTCTPIHPT
jgi:hypothetical protein